ncbi:MAG: DUF2510 domain-containing protein [Acidimicrobiales bacterium]|nr:DUF2510 domain-containing protein [Acidimicrobiales bacterium]
MIFKIIEVARIEDYRFKMCGTDKTTWILIIVFASIFGALIWQFSTRKKVLATPANLQFSMPISPPGWYREHTSGQVRYWDGFRWLN